MVTLLSLLEGITSPSIPRQMIATLNFPVLRENMDSFFPDPAAPGVRPVGNVHDMELPFLYYFLMGTLMDYDREGGTIQDMVRNSRGYDTFVRGTGRIEIVRNNRLERVFFKVPSVCRKLPPESKKNLLWDIKRDNQQVRTSRSLTLSPSLFCLPLSVSISRSLTSSPPARGGLSLSITYV